MRVLAIVVAMFAAACQPPTGGERAGADAQQQSADDDGGERFYGRERFTLVGNSTGHETGSFTEHVRDWGRTRVEIKQTTISMMGHTSRTNTRAIFRGPEIATVNLDTGAVTIATNPFYTQIVEAMRDRDGVEVGREMMTQMGGRPTGERGSYAGHDCEFWEVAQLGSRSCVTPWGATLYIRSALAGITIERTVTEVRMGDGGPDAAFEYDASRATRAPSLDDIRSKMRGG